MSGTLNCTDDRDDLVNEYMDELSLLIDKHTQLHTKTITLGPSCSWFNVLTLHDAKKLKRKLERQQRQTKLGAKHVINRNHCVMNILLK